MFRFSCPPAESVNPHITGNRVIRAYLAKIKEKGYDTTVMVIVAEGEVSFKSYGTYGSGESILA